MTNSSMVINMYECAASPCGCRRCNITLEWQDEKHGDDHFWAYCLTCGTSWLDDFSLSSWRVTQVYDAGLANHRPR